MPPGPSRGRAASRERQLGGIVIIPYYVMLTGHPMLLSRALNGVDANTRFSAEGAIVHSAYTQYYASHGARG